MKVEPIIRLKDKPDILIHQSLVLIYVNKFLNQAIPSLLGSVYVHDVNTHPESDRDQVEQDTSGVHAHLQHDILDITFE